MDRRFSVAPMMACTDRHARYLLRLISRHALLYTEMVAVGALEHGDRVRFLGHHAAERPVALQLGGNDPGAMARGAALGEAAGFAEINMNCGCPSDRVRAGCFGAALMAEPATVARCVAAMRAAVSIPVTVKTRIGIDDRDSYQALLDFCGRVVEAGCDALVIHARKAWLQGLSPKENRELPPLRYDVVERLKRDLPDVAIVLNGGIGSIEASHAHLTCFDGVMMGRTAYHDPYVLATVDRKIFGATGRTPTRAEVAREYLSYVEGNLRDGVPLHRSARHLLGLYQGRRGAKRWRRELTEAMHRPRGDGLPAIHAALEALAVDPTARAAA